ncbi:MAG: hypothetical protein ACOCXM_05940 [Myxococcota bacterium]
MMIVLWGVMGCADSRDSAHDAGADGAVDPDGALDGAAPVVGPDGTVGVCCPLETPGCNCFSTGGWAPDLSSCPRLCDLPPQDYEIRDDPHGCGEYVFSGSPSGCCLCPPDAG